ncbi:MAG: transposase [Syntrophomonas sp.]
MTTILSDFKENVQTHAHIVNFFKRFHVMDALRISKINKGKGYSLALLVQFLLGLAFTCKNLYRYLEQVKDEKPFSKNLVYRFLDNPNANWQLFLLKLGSSIVNDYMSPLTDIDRTNVLIFDDSLYSRNRSKKVELLARVYDHVEHRYVKGFRMLTAGWSDGASFVPLAFSLLSSTKADNRLYEQGPTVPLESPGFMRRQEAILSTTEMVEKLLDQVLEHTRNFSYVLFDSWFSWPTVIKQIKARQVDVICMLKDMKHITYGYNEQKYRLNELYTILDKTKTKPQSGIIGSILVDYYGIPARVVFVHNRNNKREWLAVLSTDITISDEEIIRIYGIRWDIEVYFKTCKSLLGLAKEFQVRSYDAMVAHTTMVCVRYMILSVENRDNKDDRSCGGIFYDLCAETENISFAKAFLLLLTLFVNTLKEKLMLTDDVINDLFDDFLKSVPSSMKKNLFLNAA